ncbi:MAG TPA: phosphate signaling complex protein PhoU [Phycisphaerae bacterium]|nr:phosphate signaling complex protein PhoU [Phycisphaerae bacterium]
MSHQEFDRLLEQVRARCLNMAAMVQQAVALACDAITRLDVEAARKAVAAEERIDEEDVEVERQAINLMILHHPSATDFRAVFGIVKINSNLERIGDCAASVAEQARRVAEAGIEVPREIKQIADAALKQVQLTVQCLGAMDPDMALEVSRVDDAVDALNSQIQLDRQAAMERDRASVPGNVALLVAAKYFERIGDNCVNIAEDVVYLMRGEIVRHAHDPNR